MILILAEETTQYTTYDSWGEPSGGCKTKNFIYEFETQEKAKVWLSKNNWITRMERFRILKCEELNAL